MATVHLDVPIGTPAYAALRDQLRKDILTGQIRHGSRLTIAEVVKRYGVSQMPVREALQSLEGEGLVTIQPHKGARVLSLDAKFIRNVYNIRAAIESLLACSSIPNLTQNVIDQLECAQYQLAAIVEAENPDQYFALNRDFHCRLYRLADNDEAFRIYDHYNSLLSTLRRAYGFTPQRRVQVVQEHWRIMEALESKEAERVVKAVVLHIEHGRDEMLSNMSR